MNYLIPFVLNIVLFNVSKDKIYDCGFACAPLAM